MELITGTCTTGVLAGKNIRKELKATFPKTKFSVVKRYYGRVDVSWQNGPTTDEVKEIISKYETGTFDPYTDYHGVTSTEFTKTYGGAKFIFVSREEV